MHKQKEKLRLLQEEKRKELERVKNEVQQMKDRLSQVMGLVDN